MLCEERNFTFSEPLNAEKNVRLTLGAQPSAADWTAKDVSHLTYFGSVDVPAREFSGGTYWGANFPYIKAEAYGTTVKKGTNAAPYIHMARFRFRPRSGDGRSERCLEQLKG